MNNCIFMVWMLVSIVCFQPFLFTFGICQERESKNVAEVKVWKLRVDNLEAKIRNDSKSIDDSERPFYFALLAKVLWKSNQTEAQVWLKKASNSVLSDLSVPDKNEITEKLKWTQKTTEIIASLDAKQAQPLLERIATLLESNGNDAKGNADSLVSIGRQILDSNPKLAYDFGVKSLSYGNAPELFRLIFALIQKDTGLAEQLFQLSLTAARRNPDFRFIKSLSIVFLVREGKAFSTEARRSYLELLADQLAKVSFVESERASRCLISELVTPYLEEFAEYLPNQTQTINQLLQTCSELAGKTKESTDEPKSIEELLSASRDTTDTSKKARYFYRAITLLAAQKKYAEIIAVLDDLGDTEKAAVSETAWESWRIEYATALVLKSFAEKDLPTVYKVIDRTPKNLRLYVRFRFVYTLSANDDKDLYLENLEGIRKELASFDGTAARKATSYLNLAKLYLSVQPIESGELIRNASKPINTVDSENPDFLPEKDWSPLNDYVKLPAEFLEVDEYSVDWLLSDIKSRRSRVRLELGLLESALKKLDDAKIKVEAEKKDKKK